MVSHLDEQSFWWLKRSIHVLQHHPTFGHFDTCPLFTDLQAGFFHPSTGGPFFTSCSMWVPGAQCAGQRGAVRKGKVSPEWDSDVALGLLSRVEVRVLGLSLLGGILRFLRENPTMFLWRQQCLLSQQMDLLVPMSLEGWVMRSVGLLGWVSFKVTLEISLRHANVWPTKHTALLSTPNFQSACRVALVPCPRVSLALLPLNLPPLSIRRWLFPELKEVTGLVFKMVFVKISLSFG